jgi:hypothetical protein
MMQYAYPSTLERKMKKWRYKPRVNKKTGNTMKLLSEEEEDVHLDEGMQAEENVFSVDYDVWVDEETEDVHIEKYPGHLIAYQCNSCGFKTMRLVREEIVIAPTEYSEGEMIKNYQCNYCQAKRSKTVRIAKLTDENAKFELLLICILRKKKRLIWSPSSCRSAMAKRRCTTSLLPSRPATF